MVTIDERPLTPEEQEKLRAHLLPSFCPEAVDRTLRWMPSEPWSVVQLWGLIGALLLGLIVALLAGWRWGAAVGTAIILALVVLPSVVARILRAGRPQWGLEHLQHALENATATVVRCSAAAATGFEDPQVGTHVWAFHGRGRQMLLLHGPAFCETDSFPNDEFEVASAPGRLHPEVLSVKCLGGKLSPSMWADKRAPSLLNLPAEPYLLFEGTPETIPADLARALADRWEGQDPAWTYGLLSTQQMEAVFGPPPPGPDVRGVIDFAAQPSFEPQTILRIVYRQDAAELQAARISPLEEVAGQASTPDSLREGASNVTVLERASRTVALPEMPEPLQTAEELQEYAEVAVSCSTPMADGTVYWHRANTPSHKAFTGWFNPSRSRHRPQSVLIAAYEECIRMAGLSPSTAT